MSTRALMLALCLCACAEPSKIDTPTTQAAPCIEPRAFGRLGAERRAITDPARAIMCDRFSEARHPW